MDILVDIPPLEDTMPDNLPTTRNDSGGTVKYMDIKLFRSMGWLQEINRRFLHPAGLAIEVDVDAEGNEHLSGVQDYRDDPEGMIFGELTAEDTIRAMALAMTVNSKREAREAGLGYFVQPLPPLPSV